MSGEHSAARTPPGNDKPGSSNDPYLVDLNERVDDVETEFRNLARVVKATYQLCSDNKQSLSAIMAMVERIEARQVGIQVPVE